MNFLVRCLNSNSLQWTSGANILFFLHCDFKNLFYTVLILKTKSFIFFHEGMDSCDELSKTRLSKHANAKFSDSWSYGSGTEDVFLLFYYHLRRERLDPSIEKCCQYCQVCYINWAIYSVLLSYCKGVVFNLRIPFTQNCFDPNLVENRSLIVYWEEIKDEKILQTEGRTTGDHKAH